MIGKSILNWKIIEFIGAGGMCNVYKAENEDLKGSFASIKCLKEDNYKNEEIRGRFEKEAKKMFEFHKNSGSSHPLYFLIHINCSPPPVDPPRIYYRH